MKDFGRSEHDAVLSALDRGESVLLTGVRGSGKSTSTAGLGADGRADFDDPRFAPRPTKATLDVLLREVRRTKARGRVVLVLDEIDRVAGWREWFVKARTTGANVIATHSGLLEPAEIPVGMQHVLWLPLGFRDVLRVSTGKEVDLKDPDRALSSYLRHGGFPEVVDNADPESLLLQLFDRILYQDVIRRREIRGVDILTAMAVNIVKTTAGPVSASSLKGMLSRSVDQARVFMQALHRAGLVYLAPRIEDAGRARYAAARRSYACDPGLAGTLAGRPLPLERLAETAVCLELLRRGGRVATWKARDRAGPAVLVDGKPSLLVDVCWGGESSDHRPLAAAMSRHGCGQGLLLGATREASTRNVRAGHIQVRHLPAWLLGREAKATTSPGTEPSLPVHLL